MPPLGNLYGDKNRFGTTDPRRATLTTDGEDRFDILEQLPVAEMPTSSSDPTAAPASKGRFYFRTSGGQVQLCVRFPSGAIQILCTEP